MNDKHMDKECCEAVYWKQEQRGNHLASGNPSGSYNLLTVPSHSTEPTAFFKGEVIFFFEMLCFLLRNIYTEI